MGLYPPPRRLCDTEHEQTTVLIVRMQIRICSLSLAAMPVAYPDLAQATGGRYERQLFPRDSRLHDCSVATLGRQEPMADTPVLTGGSRPPETNASGGFTGGS